MCVHVFTCVRVCMCVRVGVCVHVCESGGVPNSPKKGSLGRLWCALICIYESICYVEKYSGFRREVYGAG